MSKGLDGVRTGGPPAPVARQTYGKRDAAAETKRAAKDAGEALVALDLQGPRGHKRALDNMTNR